MNKVVEMVFGSHMYGLNTPTSDKDYKGLFIPHPSEIVLGTAKKNVSFSSGNSGSKNSVDDVDVDFYSLTKFISLACEGDTMAIDMLHCPADKLVSSSPVWDYIIQNRHRFYTSELTGVFGYMRKQAAKYGVKGSRLAALREVFDVLMDTNDTQPVRLPKSMGDATHHVKVGEITSKLPENEFCRFVTDETQKAGCQVFYEVLGRKFQMTISVAEMKKSVYKLWDEYGERARQAEANNNIDWKALSHALRGGYQLISIFKQGTISYPLAETDFIKSVKLGELPFSTVQTELEKVVGEVERLAAVSVYPKTVDREFWDKFIERVYSENIVRYYK